MALELVIPLQYPRDSHLNHKDAAVTLTDLDRGGGTRSSCSHWPFAPPVYILFLMLSSDADQQASTSPLSAGRHQRRRIMCNYNRQSKTKPFTFNELHSEGKRRLPQGGILMKQMAECSQGLTLPVPLFYSLPTFSALWGASPVSSALFVCGVRTILPISTL